MGRTYRNSKEEPRIRRKNQKKKKKVERIRESLETDDPIQPRRDESELAFISWLWNAAQS